MRQLARLVLFLLVITAACISCNKPSPKTNNLKTRVEERAETEQLSTLAKRYNAIKDWPAKLPKRGESDSPFTFDLTKALISSNDTPIVLVMELVDVTEHDGKFHAKFSHVYFQNCTFELFLDLDCSAKQADELLVISHEGLPERFALVIRVKEVTRPNFILRGTGMNEEHQVEIKSDSVVFYAKAECVDLLRLNATLSTED